MPANLPPGEEENVYCLTLADARPGERLKKGDSVVVWTGTRPLDCDLAAAVDEGNGRSYLGRLSYEPDGGFTLRDGDTLHEFEPDFDGKLGRAIHAERRGRIVQRFYTIPPPPNSNGRRADLDAKIEGLRQRLEALRESDDWADVCGGKGFQLEKQIQDLEREAVGDLWPEQING